ncbi:MAG: ABC-type multidrug transport system, ATPase component [Candidatus Nanosalina sp. J07AB43]|nr:MAG: ABC-type multidrug transport system, ATPase component [Candidatus Nanosalina sp. J07AB43]
MAVINVDGLEKSFGDVNALNGVELEVKKGEIVGVLGPNGAGKSSLMKALTGQLEYDSGNVSVLGRDPVKEPVEVKKRIGALPEREDPPSFLTGSEYFEFVSDVRETDIESDRWIEKLNLKGKLNKMTQDLSKGERQKLMISQAFFHDPDLVFVDEPLVNLDPVIQERVKELFEEKRENGGTIFLCTHVISLAEELCDRVFFLKDGEIVEEIEDVDNLKDKFLDSQE